MRTRLLPVLALALASTVGCSSAPPTLTPNQPQAIDSQRQIAQAEDEEAEDGQQTQAVAESQMPEPLSVQALPQKLDPSQVVELPADKLKELPVAMGDDRSTQQWRGRGFRSFGGRRLRFFYSAPYYYPYYFYNNFYYPYAYYPYTFAYYPYSYYSYSYYPFYLPYYSFGSYYYPYRFYRFGGRRWRR